MGWCATVARSVARHLAVYSGSRMAEPGAVVLSFDDGPGPSTAELLEVLRAHGVRATFFMLGSNVEGWYARAVRVAEEGHVLGNHGYSHARPGSLDRDAFAREIERTDRLLARVAREAQVPFVSPPPVRLPYGPAAEDERLTVLASLGRAHVHWTACFEDWEDPDPAVLVARMRVHIEEQRALARPAVLDLHDASRTGARRGATVEAVRRLLHDPVMRGLMTSA